MPRRFAGDFGGQLHELPKDIWQLSISWLSRPDLVSFVSVCKYFRDTVKCDSGDLYGCKKLMYGPPQSAGELLMRKEAPAPFEQSGFKPHRATVVKDGAVAAAGGAEENNNDNQTIVCEYYRDSSGDLVYTFHPDGTYTKKTGEIGEKELGVYFLRILAPRFGLVEVRYMVGASFGKIQSKVEMERFPLWGLGSETPRISPVSKEKNDSLEVSYDDVEATQTFLVAV